MSVYFKGGPLWGAVNSKPRSLFWPYALVFTICPGSSAIGPRTSVGPWHVHSAMLSQELWGSKNTWLHCLLRCDGSNQKWYNVCICVCVYACEFVSIKSLKFFFWSSVKHVWTILDILKCFWPILSQISTWANQWCVCEMLRNISIGQFSYFLSRLNNLEQHGWNAVRIFSISQVLGANMGQTLVKTCVKRCAASLDTIFCHSKKNREEKKERRCSSRRQNRDGICDGKDDGNEDRQFDGNMTATFKATVVKPSVDILTSVNVAVKNCPSNCPSSFPRKSWRDSGGDD